MKLEENMFTSKLEVNNHLKYRHPELKEIEDVDNQDIAQDYITPLETINEVS